MDRETLRVCPAVSVQTAHDVLCAGIVLVDPISQELATAGDAGLLVAAAEATEALGDVGKHIGALESCTAGEVTPVGHGFGLLT